MLNSERKSDPIFSEVERVWRDNRCLTSNSINIYQRWVKRFKAYCRNKNLDESSQLTLAGASTFARQYARNHNIQLGNATSIVRSSLMSWSYALQSLGKPVPPWDEPVASPRLRSKALQQYVQYMREVRGNPPSTTNKKIKHIQSFLAFLREKRRKPQRMRLQDIDEFIIVCSQRYARTTTATICSSLRCFTRFLHVSGDLPFDLASSICAPKIRQYERPHRTLPWDDVRCILQAIDRQSACGRRDYALLLMMSMYGLGAGEVIGLTLDDIDWTAATLHVVRPKTGVEYLLPLMPSIARALASYLRDGRPVNARTRHLFVTMRVPHQSLSSSVTIRHILQTHAHRAGIEADYLGTHVLRHTHACRQLELGTQPKLIGDILGHRDPKSTSAYLRVATDRLRAIALPVPS